MGGTPQPADGERLGQALPQAVGGTGVVLVAIAQHSHDRWLSERGPRFAFACHRCLGQPAGRDETKGSHCMTLAVRP